MQFRSGGGGGGPPEGRGGRKAVVFAPDWFFCLVWFVCVYLLIYHQTENKPIAPLRVRAAIVPSLPLSLSPMDDRHFKKRVATTLP